MTSCKNNVASGLVTNNGAFNFTSLLEKCFLPPGFNCAGSERWTLRAFFNIALFSCRSRCKVLAKALLCQMILKGQICILLTLKFIKYPCEEGYVRFIPWQLNGAIDSCDHPMRTWILSDLAELVGSCLLHVMVSLTPTDRCLPLSLARGACVSIGSAEQRHVSVFGNFMQFGSRRIKICCNTK